MSDNEKKGIGTEGTARVKQTSHKKAGRMSSYDDIESVENWCYHNTKKLMRKYRTTKMCISATMDKLETDLEDELGTRISSMLEIAKYMDIDLGGTYLESRMRSMQQNRMMLDLIDRSVNSLRKYDRNGEEFYWILYLKYMAPSGAAAMNDSDVIIKLAEKKIYLSQSTYYRRLNAALGVLSGILWGFTSRDTITLTKMFAKIVEESQKG